MRLSRTVREVSVRQVSGVLMVGAALAAAGCAASVNEIQGSASEAQSVSAAAPDAFSALQPKKETGVDRFLAQFPEYDGRGTIIAIFDTGVDPGAPGLAVTTDGQPKVIDVVDGTGSGDVDMTTKREVSSDGTVEGLTGRTLNLGEWVGEGAEVRVGMKPGFDLASRSLLWRLRNERKDDAEPAARALIESLKRELVAWDRANTEPDEELFRQREDLAARLSVAEELWSSWDDTGPIYDCVLFNDGGVWRALVDTDEDGDLGEEKALTNFRDERQFATFDEQSLLNFACNIYEDGDVLSIVTDCGTHGTHVAGMAAAHFPDQPELDGIAPGAQIVSVKIGDHRVGSSGLGTGVARGMRAVLDNGVDVINMSYGGASSLTDSGRTADLYRELVFDKGVVFVASAGNSGPALSTAGSAGGTTSALIGVGAAVSPEMAAAQYGVREPGQELNFNWSSRGPTLDGDTGVDIAGPGAAFAPVPNWALQKHTHMNGTSMSAPSVAGGVALLISAAKQTDTPYAPASIERALKNTARPVPGHTFVDVGAGMAQIDRAWSFMSEYGEAFDADVRYEARIRGTGFDRGDRGVYLREPWEIRTPTEVRVDLTPVFPDRADNRRKVDFDVRLNVESSAPWIQASGIAVLNHGGDDIRLRIDPTQLEPGLHTAEVLCTDAERPERGVLARVPVTVLMPTELEDDHTSAAEHLNQEPGEITRRFFAVPEGATWADVTVRRLDKETDRLLVVHSVQLDDQRAFSSLNDERWINLDESDEHVVSYPVLGGGTLEVALCNYWSNPGELDYEYEIRFGGIAPSGDLGMIGGQGATRFDVQATLGDQRVSPAGSLTTLRRTLRATDWSIEPLAEERDALWDGKVTQELVLTYEIEIDDDRTVNFVLGGAGFQGISTGMESGLMYLTDENGGYVEISAYDLEAELSEGTYTLHAHLRHDDAGELERMTTLPLFADYEISSIGLSFNRNELAGVGGRRGGFPATDLSEGERSAVFVVAPDRGDMPDFAQPGDVLWGEMTLGTLGDRLYGAGARPTGYPVWCVVPPEQEDKPEPEPKDEDEEETDPAEELADEVFELRLAALGKMEDDAAFDALLAELRGDRPDDVRLLVAEMERAADAEDAEQASVITAADAVIDAVDQDAVAAWNGVEHDEDADDYDEDRAELMERQHDALLAALRAKAKALGGEGDEPLEAGELEAFEDAIAELDRWTDLGDDDFDLKLRRELAAGRKGKALEMLRAQAGEESGDKELRERTIALMEELGWDQWAQIERRRLVLDFPPAARPF